MTLALRISEQAANIHPLTAYSGKLRASPLPGGSVTFVGAEKVRKGLEKLLESLYVMEADLILEYLAVQRRRFPRKRKVQLLEGPREWELDGQLETKHQIVEEEEEEDEDED